MKRVISSIITLLILQPVFAQITITASDMPVAGDTLRYSFASPTGTTISPGDSGANFNWNYTLTSTGQAVDSYLTAIQINPVYLITVGLTAYGYKVADSLPIPGGFLPISIQQVYTFFEIRTTPSSSFVAKAFAADISGVPTAINYTEADVWYFFPLNYLNQDSSKFRLNITIPTLGGIDETGYRITRVDGWGTITTPYYTTPVNCIRVRSEVHQIDSIPLGPIKIGFPITTVDYKWLTNEDHYPALWVSSNVNPDGSETVTSIRYRDNPIADSNTVNKVATISPEIAEIKALPNPSVNGVVSLTIPMGWKNFRVELFDMQSKEVASFNNEREINISSLPAGDYLARIISGSSTAYVKIAR
jgi:hypothetical protein